MSKTIITQEFTTTVITTTVVEITDTTGETAEMNSLLIDPLSLNGGHLTTEQLLQSDRATTDFDKDLLMNADNPSQNWKHIPNSSTLPKPQDPMELAILEAMDNNTPKPSTYNGSPSCNNIK